MLTAARRTAGLLVVAGLASCEPAVVDDSREMTFTFWGTSFTGEARMYHELVWYGPGLPAPFEVTITDVPRPCGATKYWIDLSIPEAAYAGPGTYACGTDPAGYGGLCTITVRQSPDCVAVGAWSTWEVTRPDGLYGALPGCSITVEQDDAIVRGTATCDGLAFKGGTHPDAGTTLGLSGRFYAKR